MARKKEKKIFSQLTIQSTGAKGVSIAKSPDGRPIFIPYGVPGDIVDVQTTKKKKRYYEGSIIQIHHKSDDRREPVCQYFGQCGGCKWQQMTYEKQLLHKHNQVIENLKRIGKLDLPESLPILGCQNEFYYRNKMEFSFSNSKWLTREQIDSNEEIKNKNALGFHIPKMWNKVIDIQHCHLQEEPSNAIRNWIKSYATDNNLDFFDYYNNTGFLRTLMIRTSSTGEIMVLLQFFENISDQISKLLTKLKNQFPEITSLLYTINSKANDTIYDQNIICFSGRDHIFEQMENLTFKINAKSFYQTNSEQAYLLYKVIRDFAELKGNETIYDLYTGTGTIAQFISKKAKKVIGVEAVSDAIKAAKENAKANKITNCDFFVGDMKDIFTSEFVSTHGHPDLIITDPPRDGMHKNVIKEILKINPKRIIYVSCNSATQARDLQLMDQQYKTIKVQPVDLFPQTHHVENIAVLELK